MRTIRGLALGTYYAAGANAARETPNSTQMRGLVYAVKDNRDPPNPMQSVQHPLHPADRAVQVDRTNAIEYVTAMLANRIAKLTKFFKADDPQAITQRKVVKAKTTGNRRTADQIFDGLVRTATTIPRATTIVLVDDNVQSGSSIAALDKLLGASRATAAFAVAVTDSQTHTDAMKTRRFTIEYDEAAANLDVARTLD
jgi:hypothetical protein